uniref:PUM-HD domain-containing protein n=1 Tax=Globodera pallida TaxID=36090 RepID=A0A183CAU2_GLOPA
MFDRFVRNILNGQQIIHKIRHVQTVRLMFLHQYIKNECPAVLSLGARMASTSSNRPIQRSKLLNDYRTNRIGANLQLTDLGDHVLEFALDPRGSRFIEQKLGHANPTETAHLMDALRGNVLTLSKNLYGSHVIQKALESITSLSCHECGSRVIECVLEHCTEQQKRPALEQLNDNVLTLATDQHGNFVIQHLIKHGLPEDRERIVRSLHEKVTSLSIHEYGNRVIECVLEHCTEQQKRPMLEQLHGNVLSLVTDPYGCFVIQHVIEHGLLEDRERIVRSLQGDIMKNGHLNSFCNVVNKCLIFGTMEQKNVLIDEVCTDNGFGHPPLLEMMKHPFGNTVVQKMLHVADSARRNKMMFAIKTAQLKTREIDHRNRLTPFKNVSKGAANNG